MRVIVDMALCEGNAVCVKLAPEVFEVREDDKAHLLIERPPESLRGKVQAAVQRCPRQALAIAED
jgi:ferredoxin